MPSVRSGMPLLSARRPDGGAVGRVVAQADRSGSGQIFFTLSRHFHAALTSFPLSIQATAIAWNFFKERGAAWLPLCRLGLSFLSWFPLSAACLSFLGFPEVPALLEGSPTKTRRTGTIRLRFFACQGHPPHSSKSTQEARR